MLQRPEKKTALSSRQQSNPNKAVLILVILGLIAAVWALCSPETARLTPEQISQMPLWGP